MCLEDEQILTLSFSFKSVMMASRLPSVCSILANKASLVCSMNSLLSSSFFREASSILATLAVQSEIFLASKFCRVRNEMQN